VCLEAFRQNYSTFPNPLWTCELCVQGTVGRVNQVTEPHIYGWGSIIRPLETVYMESTHRFHEEREGLERESDKVDARRAEM
jgi:hypothetical protein